MGQKFWAPFLPPGFYNWAFKYGVFLVFVGFFFFFTSLAIKKAIVHISLTLVFAQAVEGLKGEVVYTHNNTLLCLFQYHSAPGWTIWL